MLRISKSAAAKSGLVPKRSKYRAVRTVVDGHTFASKKEAKRYGELKAMERAGDIHNLELQPKFILHAPCRDEDGEIHYVKEVGKYVGDFRYEVDGHAPIVEDVKGFKTPLYRWKKKHAEAEYGIKIVEI